MDGSPYLQFTHSSLQWSPFTSLRFGYNEAMTNITVDKDPGLPRTHFRDFSDLYQTLYEEMLEQKMEASKGSNFIDV